MRHGQMDTSESPMSSYAELVDVVCLLGHNGEAFKKTSICIYCIHPVLGEKAATLTTDNDGCVYLGKLDRIVAVRANCLDLNIEN